MSSLTLDASDDLAHVAQARGRGGERHANRHFRRHSRLARSAPMDVLEMAVAVRRPAGPLLVAHTDRGSQ
jgi:hypothetical protein